MSYPVTSASSSFPTTHLVSQTPEFNTAISPQATNSRSASHSKGNAYHSEAVSESNVLPGFLYRALLSVTHLLKNAVSSSSQYHSRLSTIDQKPLPRSRESSTPTSSSTGQLLELGTDHLPKGYTIVAPGGAEGTSLALPTSEVGDFNNFMLTTGNLVGSFSGSEAGEALSSLFDANSSQSSALEAVGGTLGSAAGSAALGAAAGGAGAAGTAALSATGAAWPAAVVVAAYSQFMNIKAMKEAAGGGPLTDKEIRTALDAFGLEHFALDKVMPDEAAGLTPEELEYYFLPHQLIGKFLFGSGKHEDQIHRDRVRKHLEKIGLANRINGSHHLQLADGTQYDIGMDGQNKLTNLDGGTRRPYNVDPSHPFTPQVIGWIQPYVSLVTAGNKKLHDDFTGYFTNAALSNASTLGEARKNILAIVDRIGIRSADLSRFLATLHQNGTIDDNKYAASIAGLASFVRGTVQVEALELNRPLIAAKT